MRRGVLGFPNYRTLEEKRSIKSYQKGTTKKSEKMKRLRKDDSSDEDSENQQEMTAISTKSSKSQYSEVKAGDKEPDDEVLRLEIDEAIERIGQGRFQRRILVAAGLCFAADSMEVLLLSFLSIVLQAQWGLKDEQTSSITSSVFVGALIGTLVLGRLGDYIGRKPVFSLTAAIITVFGFLTAFANTFTALLLYRFAVGFGVGGLTVPFDTLAEFIPTSGRGTNLLVIEYFWSAGTLLVVFLAYFSLGEGEPGASDDSWRYFVALCAIPCLLSTLLGMIFVPESPRWLIMQGRNEEALSILRMAASKNGRDAQALFPPGTILYDEEDEESSNFLDLFKPQWRKITLLLWGTWAGFAFVYYGTIIAVTLAFSESAEEKKAQSESGDLYAFDYPAIFTSASSEIAGTTLAIYIVERYGRIPTQTISYVGGGLSVFALCVLASFGGSRTFMVTAAFLARMFFMGGSCSTWVSTAEILTTEIRTTGHSAANAIARIGGSFSPYVVSESIPFLVIGIVMLVVSLTTAFLVSNLPETKGKRMGEVHGDGLVRISGDEQISNENSNILT